MTIDENGRDWDTVFGSRAKPLVLAHLNWLREEFRSGVRALPWSPGCTDIANLNELIRVADLLFLSRVREFLEVQRSAMADAAATAPTAPGPTSAPVICTAGPVSAMSPCNPYHGLAQVRNVQATTGVRGHKKLESPGSCGR